MKTFRTILEYLVSDSKKPMDYDPIENALQELTQLIDEQVIGKIEKPYEGENPWEEDERHGQNKLRTTQRTNLKKVSGLTEAMEKK